MPIRTLRPYQHEAVRAVVTARRHGVRRMVVCLPTGAGKTVIFADLIRLARKQVLVLAHREELLAQSKDRIEDALDGTRTVAIEQGTKRAPDDADVVVCSIRSLGEARLKRIVQDRELGLIIYDECHHAVAEDNMRVLRTIGCFNPDWTGTLLGFTATTNRADGKGLIEVFEQVVYSRTIADLMGEGWLAPLKGFRIETDTDLSQLDASGQDFNEEELSEAVDIEERNALVARTIQELARDRRTIAFCVTVNHARNLARALNRIGVPTGMVHGGMRRDKRIATLSDFRSGRTSVLTNVGVLTEGFDDPGVSAIAMARPTRSEIMYAQCVGRGTRLHPEKTDCLVLDFVDLSRLSLLGLPTLFGLPRDLDLQGEDAREAAMAWSQIQLDLPAFEVEAGAITLAEIQERASNFNPLSLEVDPEVRAISELDWHSLGYRGLALHLIQRGGVLTITILKVASRGRRWQVAFDDVHKARFSRIEEAVEAVDYEVARMGPSVHRSALEKAPWRREPATDDLLESLLKRPVGRVTRIEAHRLLVLEDVYRGKPLD